MDPQRAHEATRSVDRLPMKPAEWVEGVRVPGTKWVVQGRLGQGGMGIVFEVRKEPGISGAMKVMHSAVAHREELASRFLAEGRLLASFRHQNIVEVIDYDTLPDGTPFMVMELLEGRTLRDSLRNSQLRGTRVTARDMYKVFSQLCEALNVLHSRQPAVIHKDVKPENVFLHRLADVGDAIVVKLLDFGLAGAAGQWSRHVLGTPRYISPEQALSQPVTERSDQYSAALVLYEIITGRLPWDVDVKNVEAMLHAHVNLTPAPPSRFCPWVSRRLDEVILRALAKAPSERWASVDQIAEGARELEDINDGSAYANLDASTTAPDLATVVDSSCGDE
jgi:serine/threonine protein kinase